MKHDKTKISSLPVPAVASEPLSPVHDLRIEDWDYCATKHAVRAFSEGLRQENTDVRVTVVSPGFTPD
jgi:NAD(P)-dependent dehydrogenase (short-subunit alcohol dehydrogenase family)